MWVVSERQLTDTLNPKTKHHKLNVKEDKNNDNWGKANEN